MLVSDAIDCLVHALETDHEYRHTWVANIAIAFQTEVARNGRSIGTTAISMNAAESFVKQLCSIPEERKRMAAERDPHEEGGIGA